MDKAYSARTPMVVHSLEKETNPFLRRRKKGVGT
jgi:hypothetical protein